MYKISVIYKSRNFQLSGNLERMVNLVRGRECFSGLSILLVYRAHQYEGGGALQKSWMRHCQRSNFYTAASMPRVESFFRPGFVVTANGAGAHVEGNQQVHRL